ncbi:hypothetical protein [Janthinobacterium sp. HLX7-2]|uniref:hypothetical protein n=1 Tax=Janthinobacterium sp. HLX7-2 TaxID=1259331 RepID=UPI003F283054
MRLLGAGKRPVEDGPSMNEPSLPFVGLNVRESGVMIKPVLRFDCAAAYRMMRAAWLMAGAGPAYLRGRA